MSIVYIGTTPSEESCAATGSKHYDWAKLQQIECRAYKQALLRVYGDPPEGSRLIVVACPHDFGTYYEVQYRFDGYDADQVEYASNVENGLSTWAEAGMWAPILYHEDNDTPLDLLEETQWLRDPLDADALRPRGVAP